MLSECCVQWTHNLTCTPLCFSLESFSRVSLLGIRSRSGLALVDLLEVLSFSACVVGHPVAAGGGLWTCWWGPIGSDVYLQGANACRRGLIDPLSGQSIHRPLSDLVQVLGVFLPVWILTGRRAIHSLTVTLVRVSHTCSTQWTSAPAGLRVPLQSAGPKEQN